MGWRFRRSIKISKGLRLNLSKGGVGISAGKKGLRVGVGPRGPYTSMGIPGTGLYNIQYSGTGHSRKASMASERQNAIGPITGALPGTGAIGCGATIAIFGIISLFASTAFGLVLLAVGVILFIAGLGNPEREVAKRKVEALQKVQIAVGYNEKGQHEEALELLKQAKDLVPDSPSIYYLIGHVLTDIEQFKEAIIYLEEAQKRHATEEAIPILLGVSYHKVGEHDKAISSLQSIPETSPLFIKGISLLAGIFQETGQLELAISTLERAPLLKRNLDEDLMQVHYCLGLFYKETGNKKKALQHLKRVYIQDADYSNVKEEFKSMGGQMK